MSVKQNEKIEQIKIDEWGLIGFLTLNLQKPKKIEIDDNGRVYYVYIRSEKIEQLINDYNFNTISINPKSLISMYFTVKKRCLKIKDEKMNNNS